VIPFYLEQNDVNDKKEEEDPSLGRNDDDLEEDEEEREKRAFRLLAASPTKFATLVLGFKPFPYQVKMLEDPSKNIIVCAARRVGKSLVMANKALWFALCHPKTSTLIVAATQRQSMLMFDKLLDYVETEPLKTSIVRKTRTLLTFTNRSRIVALPCGRTGATLRGENADLIICFPKNVKIALSNGREIPISQIEAGDQVLSYNVNTGSVEVKRVLRTFRRNYTGSLVKIEHENGTLVCTPNHRIYAGEYKEKIQSSKLNRGSRLWVLNGPRGQTAPTLTGALRRSPRRSVFDENQKKICAINSTFLHPSRVCDVQVLANSRFCEERTSFGPESRMGGRGLSFACLSGIHEGEVDLLSKWQPQLLGRNADCDKQGGSACAKDFEADLVLYDARDDISKARESDHVQQNLQVPVLSFAKEEVQTEVFNIEVEDNHNYFANGVLVANCDEAAFVPDDVILSVMMPMLATTDGTMIMLSTPWDKGSFFFRAFNSAIWSKYRFKTADNPLVKKEWLEQQLEMVGEKRFKQEYLGEFVDDEGTYFSMNTLRPCVHVCADNLKAGAACSFCKSNREGGEIASSSSGIELYAGYDPGGMVDPAALVVVQRVSNQQTTGKDENRAFKPAFKVLLTRTFSASEKRRNYENIPKENGQRNEGDLYTQFNAQISDIHRKSPFKKLMVDSTGIGTPILSHLKQLGLTVEGMNMHRKNQEEIFSNLRILFETRKVELPDNMELLSSLNCIVTERDRLGGYVFSHPSGTHNDLAFALALAVWAGGKGGGIGIVMKDEPPKKSPWRVSEWGEGYR
jgi:hypothetical protein